ncbi:host attachment family protein [Sphingomonas solaris]|uniref:Host attachment protein n=1 Tax=Alterirhizorhabdus solaris TaxID=2529389 RepID=A0A558RDT8_9SPHN|nr:host attachment family protein [Sphingomonas solaris]TVV77352.1 host attachment protein [Sphingomonas solaris]
MANLNYPENTFVVVATGEGAKTFRVCNGSLEHQGDWSPGHLADDGPAGKTPPDMPPHELNEATFAKLIAQRLYPMAHAGEFDALILAADPDTLGQIRPSLHQEVTSKIVLELAKTLTNSSVDDIERSIANG